MERRAAFDDETSPFHAGERAVQQRLGVRDSVERGGRRMIGDSMPEQHRDFFEQLPFVVVGSLDGAGRPWASLLSGEPGFVTSPDPRSLIVAGTPVPGDPLRDNLREGAPLAVLGIELETRRRNRANGRVVWSSARGFELFVEQASATASCTSTNARAVNHALDRRVLRCRSRVAHASPREPASCSAAVTRRSSRRHRPTPREAVARARTCRTAGARPVSCRST